MIRSEANFKPLDALRLSIWVGSAIIFLAFGALPLLSMIAEAIRTTTPAAVLRDPLLWPLLGRTIGLSLAVAAGASVLGTAAGYLLGATSWHGKTLARIVLILPLAVPPYLHAIGWTTLLRPRGGPASFLSFVFGFQPSSISEILYSFVGAAAILSLAYFPIAMLFSEKSLALSSPALSEAAQVFGANRWQTFSVARWPFLRPAVASSAMIIFLLTACDLGVPTILKVPVFNFEVFTQLSAFNDVTAATLLTLPLLFVGLLVLNIERRLTVGAPLEPDVQDIEPPRPASARQARVNQIVFTCLAILLLGLPIGSIVFEGARLDALTQMARLAQQPVVNTFRYAISTSLIITCIAFTLAWILRKARPWLLRITDWVLVIGFAVPSTILALALLAVYDRPGISQWVTPIVLVVAALVVRYVILGYRIASAAIGQIPNEIFEAAALDGAGPVLTAWHILLPLTQIALMATIAIAFVFAIGEIGSTILLYPPGGETLPIALYAIEANSPRSYVAAMTLIQLLVTLVPLAVVTLAGNLIRNRLTS